jgi:Iap family predicted aminopeptidase
MRIAYLVSLLIPGLFGQQIKFNQVLQPVVESRLRAYPIKNKDRQPALRQMFEDAGCKSESLSEQKVKGAKAPNLICTQEGATDSVILVGAHFDFVDKGYGVVDNWTGASLLPTLYQSLSDSQRKHTFRFVAFTGEELGLLGSKGYVKTNGQELTKVKAMVNIDTLGLAETKVWSSHADKNLLEKLSMIAAAMKLPVAGVNVDGVGSSDSEPFRAKQIPSLTLHSLTTETLNILHSNRDKIEVVKLDEYYRSYRLIAGFLAMLDRELE